MNEHPCDWNQAAEWLAAGELEYCDETITPPRWITPVSALWVDGGLSKYRRKQQPPKLMEFWAVYAGESDDKTVRMGFPYKSLGECLSDGHKKESVVHFREVKEMPPLTDEECDKIWSQRSVQNGERIVRSIFVELKKIGRAQ